MSDQPKNDKKPVRVAIIGHLGRSKYSKMAAIGAAMALATSKTEAIDAENRALPVDDAPTPVSDWHNSNAGDICAAEPAQTRNHDRFGGDRTYESVFTRRSRLAGRRR